MKRKDLAPQAENMYVCSQMEFKEIAVELGVSERSLRVWAKRDNWKEKRQNYLNDQTALQHLLQKFAVSLTRHVMSAIDDGGELNQTKILLLRTVLDKAVPTPKVKAAKEAPADDDAGDKPQQDPIEAVKQFLGL